VQKHLIPSPASFEADSAGSLSLLTLLLLLLFLLLQMAANADLYVNDAFGTAHRAHTSTEGVAQFLKPAVAGFLLQKELDYLDGAVSNPKKPFVAIVGGSKVSTKIPVIESLLEKADKIIIGGGMIFTFYVARGLKVGKSMVETDKLELAKKLEAMAKAKGVELILPVDVCVADKFDAEANAKVRHGWRRRRKFNQWSGKCSKQGNAEM
jgi:phosphoglycerate kinase